MKSFTRLLCINIVIIALISIWAFVNFNAEYIYRENGFLENAQVVYLVLAGIVFFAASIKNGERAPLIPLFFSILCAAFIFRELDFERISDNAIVVAFASGLGRNIIMALLIAGVLCAALLRFKFYFAESLKWFKSKSGLLFVLFGILVVAASVFEEAAKADIIAHGQFFEEYFETLAYCALFISGMVQFNAR